MKTRRVSLNELKSLIKETVHKMSTAVLDVPEDFMMATLTLPSGVTKTGVDDWVARDFKKELRDVSRVTVSGEGWAFDQDGQATIPPGTYSVDDFVAKMREWDHMYD